MTELRTERLLLRHWRDEDLEPFAELNADPEVMRHFPATFDREASDELAARIRSLLDERGWGLWAVEVVDGPPFAGFVGLHVPDLDTHFMPCVEIGWRLAREHWGNGYATEAARAVLRYAFGELGFEEVVAMTRPANTRSVRVMEKLGMTSDPADDFEHPRDELHVLYRIRMDANA